jgi:hypothetical protein
MLRPLSFLRHFLVCAAICYALFLPAAEAETWREVRSPHFRVITDGSDGDGRTVAKEFEQMRSVFAARFNNAAVEAGAPLLIFATREAGLKELAPSLWKDREKYAGEFYRGWERQYAMVRLDTYGDDNQSVIFHEYAHSVLHANIHWLPMWVDEGMAEFYAYTRFQGDHIYVGGPSGGYGTIKSHFPLPIADMLTANGRTYASDPPLLALFYAEAWAMVHYMILGPDMGGGAKFNQFLALLEGGTPQPQAFQQVFGDPKAFGVQLSNYIARFALPAAQLPPFPVADAKTFPVKVLTTAEANYEMGAFDIGIHDTAVAKTFLKSAEAANPALSGPHEELGFLAWREGHDGDARAEWQKAASDPSFYRSRFALLMSGVPLKLQTAQQLEQTALTLEAINKAAPGFAPAFVELAILQWQRGQLNQAYKTAHTAEKLEPWRAGYHLLIGYILLQGNQPKAAEEYARSVATRWPGPDHDEAVDLWNAIPADKRGAGPALTAALPKDATVARGRIVSSSCDKDGLHVVLQPMEPNAALTLTAKGSHESGFSDTLWVGEDHYTSCFHLTGLPAVVAYKAEAGEDRLQVFEVRDDLPIPSIP